MYVGIFFLFRQIEQIGESEEANPRSHQGLSEDHAISIQIQLSSKIEQGVFLFPNKDTCITCREKELFRKFSTFSALIL